MSPTSNFIYLLVIVLVSTILLTKTAAQCGSCGSGQFCFPVGNDCTGHNMRFISYLDGIWPYVTQENSDDPVLPGTCSCICWSFSYGSNYWIQAYPDGYPQNPEDHKNYLYGPQFVPVYSQCTYNSDGTVASVKLVQHTPPDVSSTGGGGIS